MQNSSNLVRLIDELNVTIDFQVFLKLIDLINHAMVTLVYMYVLDCI